METTRDGRFVLSVEGASGGPLRREGSRMEIVFEGITPTPAITVATETRSLWTKKEVL